MRTRINNSHITDNCLYVYIVGTIYTMAPQVLQGIYSSKADLWAVGVIAYMLLSASKPFYSRRRRKMIDLIMRCDYSCDSPIWQAAISADAKDFISKLIVVDPKHRWDAAEALKHPWIVKREQLPDEKPSEALLEKIDDSLLNYRHTSALKKLALNVVAHRSSTADILQLRTAFDQFDVEKDGIISYAEFKQALEKMNYSDETLEEIFASVVSNSRRVVFPLYGMDQIVHAITWYVRSHLLHFLFTSGHQ